MYIVPFLYLIKDDFISFYVSFLFCNNYFVNGCVGVFFFRTVLRTDALVGKELLL